MPNKVQECVPKTEHTTWP